jgi:hypothetical protein
MKFCYNCSYPNVVCYGFCLQAVTALQDTAINLKQKEGIRKNILAKHLIPGSDLVAFLNGGIYLDGTCAAVLGRHSFFLVMRDCRHNDNTGAETFGYFLSLFL